MDDESYAGCFEEALDRTIEKKGTYSVDKGSNGGGNIPMNSCPDFLKWQKIHRYHPPWSVCVRNPGEMGRSLDRSDRVKAIIQMLTFFQVAYKLKGIRQNTGMPVRVPVRLSGGNDTDRPDTWSMASRWRLEDTGW